MNTRLTLSAALIATAVAAGITLAVAAAPPRRPASGAPTLLALPPAVPGVVLGGLRAERLADRGPICDLPGCIEGDDLCRHAVFEAVMDCALDGRLEAVLGATPGPASSVFRARGPGLTLYGSMGSVGGSNADFLRGVARLVEQ